MAGDSSWFCPMLIRCGKDDAMLNYGLVAIIVPVWG